MKRPIVFTARRRGINRVLSKVTNRFGRPGMTRCLRPGNRHVLVRNPESQLDMQQVRPEYHTWDVVVEDDGLEWFSLTPGPLLEKAMHASYLAIRVYLDEGINVIADDLIWTREWLVDFLRVFAGYEVCLVGVHVSDEEGARREVERGNRLAGASRGIVRAAHALCCLIPFGRTTAPICTKMSRCESFSCLRALPP